MSWLNRGSRQPGIYQRHTGIGEVRRVAGHNREPVLDRGGGNHRVALGAGIGDMQRRAHRRGVVGKRQDATGERGAHACQPSAQRIALRGRAALQGLDAHFQLQDGDGGQVKHAGRLRASPSPHLRRLMGLAMAQLRNHIGIENKHGPRLNQRWWVGSGNSTVAG